MAPERFSRISNSTNQVDFMILLSVVKPKKKCVITNESTFSVTGFLTFAVVSVTAVANVLANINNNNDNNNVS